MNPSSSADQWYYLVGPETHGPVPSAQIAQMIRAGSLTPATLVVQAGWQTWTPASTALANLLSGGRPGAAAPEPPTYAIRITCVSGPDTGKAYMVGPDEVSIGRVSGIGEHDPQVAENHVILSWQNNVLHFRAFPGSMLRVAGAGVTQGSLSNGQQFQLGASTWQVGAAPVELTGFLGSLGRRLNALTSTDKLEGFSLGTFFSEVFKGRKPGEMEKYFVVGTSKTTPPIEDVETGWPKPWFFMRMLLFLGGVYVIFYQLFDTFHNPLDVPGLIIVGSLVVPLTCVFLCWELNTPRNVSFGMVLVLVCLGGVISLFVAMIGFSIANLQWLGAASAGFVEETSKLLAVVLVVRNTKYKYILNGLVFGAAIGAGFGAFETAGYAYSDGFFNDFLAYFFKNADAKMDTKQLGQVLDAAQYYGYAGMLQMIHLRSVLAPFMHVVWTSISAAALWRVKGSDRFRLKMLADPSFLRAFAVPVLLHFTWNSPLLRFDGLLSYAKYLGLGAIAWYVAFSFVQQGLKQVRDEQVAETKKDYLRTQQILTTTGHYRAQPSV